MIRKTLITAGWLAMTSAVLTIPWFILTFFLAEHKGGAAKAAEAAMLVIGTVLTVYLLVALRRLLHDRHGFRQADIPIPVSQRIEQGLQRHRPFALERLGGGAE